MEVDDIDIAVATVRYNGNILWYRSDRELWILDYKKWEDAFIAAGYDCPEDDGSDRDGIQIVNEETAEHFLKYMKQFEVEKNQLSYEIAKRFPHSLST